ncbi:MAG: hypothetical protein M1829_006363 [Trizodia sp. TS-e1964]|nr:MAG: hypothetical protein M1829_006363 [Trizodia sp. TS-e1964]
MHPLTHLALLALSLSPPTLALNPPPKPFYTGALHATISDAHARPPTTQCLNNEGGLSPPNRIACGAFELYRAEGAQEGKLTLMETSDAAQAVYCTVDSRASLLLHCGATEPPGAAEPKLMLTEEGSLAVVGTGYDAWEKSVPRGFEPSWETYRLLASLRGTVRIGFPAALS